MSDNFFDSQTDSSKVKANIVAEYFPQYCRILLRKGQRQIRYIDLFAGPGKYKDGQHSTPLLLAKTCAEDALLAQKVWLIFNDKEYMEELKTNFYAFFPKGSFKTEPYFTKLIVGENSAIDSYLTKDPAPVNPNPTLLFIDPWGYKVINTTVLSKFLTHWGNELFLFVNIKRVHAAIENNKFDDMMQLLFPTTIEKIRNDRKYIGNVSERVNLIMNNLATEFEIGANEKLFHTSFKFQETDSKATSHFIIHFTKHPKGYELIKQIYHDYDNIGATLDKDGCYTFDEKYLGSSQHSLINFGDENVIRLSESLANEYKGRKISALDLFKSHQVRTRYCASHYSKTLKYMVEKGLVRSSFIDDKQHKTTVLINSVYCILEFN